MAAKILIGAFTVLFQCIFMMHTHIFSKPTELISCDNIHVINAYRLHANAEIFFFYIILVSVSLLRVSKF